MIKTGRGLMTVWAGLNHVTPPTITTAQNPHDVIRASVGQELVTSRVIIVPFAVTSCVTNY